MARTYRQKGDTLKWANLGAAKAAGDVVVMGDTVGVAETDIAAVGSAGEGSVMIVGVHLLAKKAGVAWVQGDQLDWDASSSAFAKTGQGTYTGDVTKCAIAAAPALAGDTEGEVRLCPGSGTVI